MAHVDWALENMPSKSKLSKDRATLVAADKANKEDDLHGLGALLFDDALPTAAAKAMAEEEILKKNGIRYTHRNDEILAPNAIAVRREKEVVRVSGFTAPFECGLLMPFLAESAPVCRSA